MSGLTDYTDRHGGNVLESLLQGAQNDTVPRSEKQSLIFLAPAQRLLTKEQCELSLPCRADDSISTKPVVTKSLARGLISRWRKKVRAEYTSIHGDVMDDFFRGHRKRGKSLRATEAKLRKLANALLHLERLSRNGKSELRYALIQAGRLRTDPQLGIQVMHIDSRGRTSSRTLSISLTEHYLIRVVQAKRCQTIEEVRDAVAEIMIHYLKFNYSQEHGVSPPDRYQDDRKVWMVTMQGAHLTQLKNGLPSFAITYLPRESWDPRREGDWTGVSSDNPMIIRDQT